jgi:hypothetical protein
LVKNFCVQACIALFDVELSAISWLEQRISGLAQDMVTAEAQANAPLTIGEHTYPREQALEALATRLKTLPATVHAPRHLPLGRYRGLSFGIALYPGLSPDVYVEGVLTRLGKLSREHHGPRAVLGAVERTVAGYAAERDRAARELQIAQGQLRDYAERRIASYAVRPPQLLVSRGSRRQPAQRLLVLAGHGCSNGFLTSTWSVVRAVTRGPCDSSPPSSSHPSSAAS